MARRSRIRWPHQHPLASHAKAHRFSTDSRGQGPRHTLVVRLARPLSYKRYLGTATNSYRNLRDLPTTGLPHRPWSRFKPTASRRFLWVLENTIRWIEGTDHYLHGLACNRVNRPLGWAAGVHEQIRVADDGTVWCFKQERDVGGWSQVDRRWEGMELGRYLSGYGSRCRIRESALRWGGCEIGAASHGIRREEGSARPVGVDYGWRQAVVNYIVRSGTRKLLRKTANVNLVI